MGAQVVARVEVDGRPLDVVGCFDAETPVDTFDFYDVHDAGTGECLNLGAPFFACPSVAEIRAVVAGPFGAETGVRPGAVAR